MGDRDSVAEKLKEVLGRIDLDGDGTAFVLAKAMQCFAYPHQASHVRDPPICRR